MREFQKQSWNAGVLSGGSPESPLFTVHASSLLTREFVRYLVFHGSEICISTQKGRFAISPRYLPILKFTESSVTTSNWSKQTQHPRILGDRQSTLPSTRNLLPRWSIYIPLLFSFCVLPYVVSTGIYISLSSSMEVLLADRVTMVVLFLPPTLNTALNGTFSVLFCFVPNLTNQKI